MINTRSTLTALFLVMLLTAAFGVSACRVAEPEETGEDVEQLQGRVEELEQEVQLMKDRLDELESSQMVAQDGRLKVVSYFGLSGEDRFYTVPVLRPADADVDLKTAALQEMIAGPDEESVLSPIAPPETEILGLEVEDTTATVDLSSEITTYATGSAGESLVIAGIVNTLTEFPDVDEVIILVEGEEGVSLGGHFELSEPLERFEDFIP